ncbi:hypothetical protein AB0J83_30885 [Actinoplanes sp. NPDC049596]|uniref:hypothetical protein n=1 Tax=unclassified Actinoplanes TaxID=2626549 RepID=UPI0034430995
MASELNVNVLTWQVLSAFETDPACVRVAEGAAAQRAGVREELLALAETLEAAADRSDVAASATQPAQI